ncbi:MAG: putative toxin-antitoxin system toxin component, PIN family [Bacteroidota bacterium]
MRVIFDTNILISRLLASHSLLARAVDVGLASGLILASDATLNELADVLSRRKFDKYVSIEDRRQFLHHFLYVVEKVEIIRTVKQCRDTKDDQFLALALNGRADYLVTGDDDLLQLKVFHDTKIVTAKEFIEWLNA